jgi:hypothetical protein
MSYDLYFYKKQDNNVSKKEIFKYLEENNVKKEDPAHTNYVYENESTGVYFIIEDDVVGEDFNEKEEIKNFEGFESLNFALLLNNIRPDFFGKETSFFVDKLVKKFDLYTFDFIDDLIFKPKEGEIYERWSEPNKQFSLKPDFADSLFFYPLERSNKIWKYSFCLKEMQDELGGNYYVPNVFYIKDKDTNKVITVTTWTDHIPTVIPEVDFIMLNQITKGFFKNTNKSVIVSYDTLMKQMGNYFEEYKNNCKIIRPENSSKCGNVFLVLPEEKQKESFEPIGLHSITNYR